MFSDSPIAALRAAANSGSSDSYWFCSFEFCSWFSSSSDRSIVALRAAAISVSQNSSWFSSSSNCPIAALRAAANSGSSNSLAALFFGPAGAGCTGGSSPSVWLKNARQIASLISGSSIPSSIDGLIAVRGSSHSLPFATSWSSSKLGSRWVCALPSPGPIGEERIISDKITGPGYARTNSECTWILLTKFSRTSTSFTSSPNATISTATPSLFASAANMSADSSVIVWWEQINAMMRRAEICGSLYLRAKNPARIPCSSSVTPPHIICAIALETTSWRTVRGVWIPNWTVPSVPTEICVLVLWRTEYRKRRSAAIFSASRR